MALFSVSCRLGLSKGANPVLLTLSCLLSALLLLSLPLSPQDLPQAISPKEQKDIFKKVVANQKRTDAALDIYERIERIELRRTTSDPKPFETKVWQVFPAGTGTNKILLGPDAKPTNTESFRVELEKLERQLVWAAEEGAAQREAYAKLEKRRKERNELIDATHEAFLFTLVGYEMRGDRKLAKYNMVPNPKYKPTSRSAMLFTKVRGSLWIDEESGELAKIEGYVTEDIALALFFAKIYRGSYFMQERYEIEPSLWLPTYQQYDFDGRRFLIPFAIHERTLYSNYRRVGPPTEALSVVRAELDKLKGVSSDP